MKSTTDMTVGSPTRHLILFALPALIGNIFQQVYNIADSTIVGRFVGPDALAAVGATGSITFLFFALFNGLIEVVGRFTVPILFTRYLGMGATGIWVSAGIVWAISGITAWMRLVATHVLSRGPSVSK